MSLQSSSVRLRLSGSADRHQDKNQIPGLIEAQQNNNILVFTGPVPKCWTRVFVEQVQGKDGGDPMQPMNLEPLRRGSGSLVYLGEAPLPAKPAQSL